MSLHTKKQQSTGSYQLSQNGDVVTIVLKGKMADEVIRSLGQELVTLAHTIRQHGGRPTALIDVSALGFADRNTTGRKEAKRFLAETPMEAWAIFGSSQPGMVIEYTGRSVGLGDRIHYFPDRQGAESWLRGEISPQSHRSSVGLVIGISLGLIGTAGLIGWLIDEPVLTRILPSLRPINPVAAAGLVTLGVAFFCYWIGALKPLRILGWTGIILGATSLLPLQLDMLLFADKLQAAGAHVQLADSAAICFILSGLLGLLANRTERWVQPAEYTFAGLMGLIAAFNIYGQLYAYDFIYSINDSFVMALSLAIAFLITSIGMVILVVLRRTRSALQRVSRTGWLVVIALICVQVATYGAWVQSKERTAGEARHTFTTKATEIDEQVNTRIQAYVNTLHGFRGLFAASTDVSQGDFEAYYSSLNLTQTYPGLRSIALISAVKTSDLPAFVAKQKADNSLLPGGRPQFKIQEQSAEPLHFISTYASGTPTSSILGRDLTSLAGRSTIYNNALKSDGYYSSGTITFPATSTQAAAKGFFIATPVRTASSSTSIGVVSANFNYTDFFGTILKTADKDLSISVSDTTDNTPIYTSGPKINSSNRLAQEFTVSLAKNQSWRVAVQAPVTFGVSANQNRLSTSILFFGQLFTLLLAGIFVIQIRARGQALALADAATADLQIERDNIAALHIKDEAMLAGIGEGLIVVDKTGKIEVVNNAATELLGYESSEMIDQNILTVLRATNEKGEVIPESKRPHQVALKHSKIVTSKLNYIRKDYRQLPVKSTVAPIMLRGKLIGAIEVFGDITREKQLEHMKDEFLSVASHELRTPMGAIRANLSMIIGGDYGPVNKDLLEPLSDMKNSTIRLVELVSDLLNVARIEAGRMQFSLDNFDVTDAAHTVVADLFPLGKEKGVHISLVKHRGAKLVQGDVDKVKQVLINLIGNSLKFTDKGSITVTVTPQDAQVEIAVTDTGIGITPDDQKKLFGKFNQITSAQAGKPAGTGLGLYISREMIRKMGGDMWIKDSTITQGSTFAFTLPLADSASAKKAKHAVEQEAKLHPDQV